MHSVLVQHPEICCWSQKKDINDHWRWKEPHFFDLDFHRGLEWYESRFDTGGSVRLDSTPNYIVSEETDSLRRLAATFPDARMLILMRDPVQRAFSAWSHWKELPPSKRWGGRNDPFSFYRSILNHLTADPDTPDYVKLVSTGCYARWIRAFLELFPRDQLLPLFTTDFKQNFEMTMDRVAQFAGLGEFAWTPLNYHVRNFHGWLPDRRSARLLEEIYRPHNEALEQLLDTPLPWRDRPARFSGKGLLRRARAPKPPAKQRIRLVFVPPKATNIAEPRPEIHARTLANLLQSRGHQVSVLIATFEGGPIPSEVHAAFEGLHVDIAPPQPAVMLGGGTGEMILATSLMELVDGENWDSMILPVWSGLAFCMLGLLRQGHARHPCRISAYLLHRRPATLERRRRQVFLQGPHEMQVGWMEKRCLEMADDVLLESRSCIEACFEEGWLLTRGVKDACFGWSDMDARNRWLRSFDDAPAPRAFQCLGIARDAEPPLISVCMATCNRSTMLERVIDAFENQTWPNLEMVVVNDGSTDSDALATHARLKERFDAKGWQWIDQGNAGPAAARTRAAQSARGPIVLFADDDNFPMRHHVMALATTMFVGGLDIAGAHMVKFSSEAPPRDIFEGTCWWMPAGGDIATGVVTNVFGETSVMMRRDDYFALGGFPNDMGREAIEEDRILLGKAALHGYAIAHCPRPTYWYFDNPSSRHILYNQKTWPPQAAAVDLYCRDLSPELRDLFEFLNGLWDPIKHRLHREFTDGRPDGRLAKENRRLRNHLQQLLTLISDLLESRRWRFSNIPRLIFGSHFTYRPLQRQIAKTEQLLGTKAQIPPGAPGSQSSNDLPHRAGKSNSDPA